MLTAAAAASAVAAAAGGVVHAMLLSLRKSAATTVSPIMQDSCALAVKPLPSATTRVPPVDGPKAGCNPASAGSHSQVKADGSRAWYSRNWAQQQPFAPAHSSSSPEAAVSTSPDTVVSVLQQRSATADVGASHAQHAPSPYWS
eukprot:12850-Heterococcus_DN1.PRE.1